MAIFLSPQINVNDEAIKIIKLSQEQLSQVKKGDKIFEVETSKANVDLEVEDDGYIKYLCAENDEIKVNEPIAYIGKTFEETKEFNLKSETKKDEEELNFTKKAKNIIEQKNINIDEFKTLLSKFKIITEKNLLEIINDNSRESKTIGKIQQRIKSVVEISNQNIPTAYIFSELNLNLFNDKLKSKNKIIGIIDIFLKITYQKLKEFKYLNYEYDGIIFKEHESYSIGYLTEIEKKLYNLNLDLSDAKNYENVNAIRLENLKNLISNKINHNKETPCFFSISHIDNNNITHHVPIVYPKQNALLAIGPIRKKLIFDKNKNIAEENYINLVLAYDHRYINGNYAAEFLNSIIYEIENKL